MFFRRWSKSNYTNELNWNEKTGWLLSTENVPSENFYNKWVVYFCIHVYYVEISFATSFWGSLCCFNICCTDANVIVVGDGVAAAAVAVAAFNIITLAATRLWAKAYTANTIFSFRFFVGLVWFGRARLAWWGCRFVSFGCTNDCRFHKCLTFNGITTTHHVSA